MMKNFARTFIQKYKMTMCFMIFTLLGVFCFTELVLHLNNEMRTSTNIARITHLRAGFVYPLLGKEANKFASISEDWHGTEMIDLVRLPLKPNMFHPKKMKYVSWREWVLEFSYYAQMPEDRNLGNDNEVAMSLFQTYNQPKEGQTNFVFVVGERTFHDFNLDDVLKTFPDDFDKILILEYPNSRIPWNSLQDISVNEARVLWRENVKNSRRLRQEIVYVTLRGRYGVISAFSIEEDFVRMLILSDSEIERYKSQTCQPDGNGVQSSR